MGKVDRVLVALLLAAASARPETFRADPSNYQAVVDALQPGDIVELEAGEYPDGLDVYGRNGTPDAWIVIRGPASGPQPVFLGDPSVSRDTIQIQGSSYVALENLTCDGRDVDGVFGVNTKGGTIHHIRVENCTFVGYGAHQQSVAISTKTTTWGWIVRRNRILGAGTGMYFGNSDGSDPFVAGVIEHNYVEDPEGYCLQVKHQNSRPAIAGLPTTPQRTVIRHNVFVKGDRPSGDGDRPNVLVDGFPDSGDGSQDLYEIYGNLFVHNPREALLQVSGRVAVHDNIFVDCAYEGIFATHHNKPLKTAHVYNNTFYGTQRAVVFNSPAQEDDRIVGNLAFTRSEAFAGSFRVANAADNLSDSVANAALHVVAPSILLGVMDFYPLPGRCQGPALDLSPFASHLDRDRDFNGDAKGSFAFRGAYAGEGVNPGWRLDAGVKTLATTPPPADSTPPTGTLRIGGGAATTASLLVSLELSATDPGPDASGMGAGAQMRFSNDGANWSPAVPYADSVAGWDLSAYGGDAAPGTKTVHARLRDAAGNWSTDAITASVDYLPGPGGSPPPSPGSGGGCSSAPGERPGSLLASYLLGLSLLPLRRR